MSEFLRTACKECLNDRNINDEDLLQRLYDYMHGNYEEKQQPWNYTLIDKVADELLKQVEFRKLDGTRFRVERNGKMLNICFSDLTDEEMFKVLVSKNEYQLRDLCILLGRTLRNIGDQFDLVLETKEE